MKPTTCKHWRGTVEDTCNADVDWLKLVGGSMVGIVKRLPCLRPELAHLCDKHEFKTAEEVEEEERFFQTRMEQFKKEMPFWSELKTAYSSGGAGIVECPRCGGRCHFSVAGYNGHLHATCETKNCVSFME